MKNILYVPEIRYNFLSIITLNRKRFEIRFRDQDIKIIDILTNKIIAKEEIQNSLYQLIELVLKKIFVFDKTKSYKISETTKDKKNINIFRRIYKRLNYSKIYRLKNLYLFIERVEIVTSSTYFQCNIYDQSKILQIINYKTISKTIRLDVRL